MIYSHAIPVQIPDDIPNHPHCFFMRSLNPSDPATIMSPPDAIPELRSRLQVRFKLDKSLLELPPCLWLPVSNTQPHSPIFYGMTFSAITHLSRTCTGG